MTTRNRQAGGTVKALQELLDDLVDGIPERILCEVVVAKFVEQGVTLSAREREKLAKHLRTPGEASFVLRRWKFWDRRSVSITLTPKEINRAEGMLREFLEQGLPEVVRTATDETSRAMLADFKERWDAESRAQRRDLHGFRGRLRKRWEAPLEALRMHVTVAREMGGLFGTALAEAPDSLSRKHLIEVLGRLHARACQIAEEVVCLLEGGFADGAMARWRTLHEVAVVASLVAAHGEDLAERYVLYQAIESKRAAAEYQRCQPALGFEPLAGEEMAAISHAYDEAISRFGSEFGRRDYGWAAYHLARHYDWAARDLRSRGPTFRDIERAVGVDHLRSHYKLASHNVHANPKGVFVKLGLLTESEVLLAGPSDAGLEEPGQCTALSLSHVCAAHFSVVTQPTIDHIVLLKIVSDLVPEIADSFTDVHRRMLSEEA
jgi:Family of unknown function (DUF5677)